MSKNLTTNQETNVKGEDNVIRIETQAQLVAYRNVITRKPMVGTLFIENKDGFHRMFVQEIAWSPLMDYATLGHGEFRTKQGGLRILNNMQLDFVKMNNLDKKKAKLIAKFGVLVMLKETPEVWFPAVQYTNKLVGWTNGETEISVENMVVFNTDKVRFYKPFTASASDVRQISLWFMDVTNGDRRADVANDMTGGAFNIHLNEFMTLKSLVNMMARTGLWVAPSKKMSEVPGILLIEDKIKNYVKPNGETWDGGIWTLDEWEASVYSKVLSEELGTEVVVESNAVTGLHTQGRVTVVNAKFSSMSNDNNQFNLLTENFTKRYKTRIIGDSNNVVMIMDMNAAKLLGDIDTRKPVWYLLDIFKASDTKMSVQFFEKFGHVNVEKHAQKFMDNMIKPDMDELFMLDKDGNPMEIAPAVPTPEEVAGESGYMVDVLTKMNRHVVFSDASLLTAKGRPMLRRWEKGENKLNTPAVGRNVKLWFEDTQLFLRDPEKVLKGRPGILAYNQVRCKSLEKLVKQLYDELSKGLDDDAAKALLRKLKMAVSLKYPAMGMLEAMLEEIRMSNEIRKEVNALDCSKEEKAAIMTRFMTCSDASKIMAAEEPIKNHQAGSDIDGDGSSDILLSEFEDGEFDHYKIQIIYINDASTGKKNYLSKNFASVTNRVKLEGTAKVKEGECTIDNLIGIGYLNMVLGENIGVGPITRRNDLVMTLYYAMKNGDIEPAMEVFRAFGADEFGGIYISPLKREKFLESGEIVHICLDDQERIIEAITSMDVTDEDNIEAALVDLNIAHRMLQEMTIDAAKKGTVVPYKFDKLAEYKPTAFLWNGANTKEFLSSLKGERIKFNFTRKGRTKGIKYFKDVITEVQDKIAEFITDAAETLGDVIENACLPEEEVIYLSNIYDKSQHALDIDETIKYMYRACAMTYMNNSADEDEYGYDDYAEDYINVATAADQKEEAQKEFDDEMMILDNLARWILENVELDIAGDIIKASSISTGRRNPLDPKRTNQMPYNVMMDAAMARLLRRNETIKICGYKLNGKCEIGEVLDFNAGLAINKVGKTVLLKDSTYTGTLTVMEHDGAFYAAKDIEIDRKPVDKNHIAVRVRRAFNVNAMLKGKVEDGEYETLEQILVKAGKIMLVPKFIYNSQIVKDAIVAVDLPLKSGKLVTVPVARYGVGSAILEGIYDGMSGTMERSYIKGTGRGTTMFFNMNVEEKNPTGESNYRRDPAIDAEIFTSEESEEL
jgi:hypothetical protein